MHALRTIGLSIVGGAVGAALLILVLVVAFDFGQTATSETPDTGTKPVPTVTGPSEPATPSGPGDASFSPADLYAAAADGVVMVRATFSSAGLDPWWGSGGGGQALGTGFVASADGDILTNAHVVLNDQGGTANEVSVFFRQGDDDVQVEAELVGVDGDSDVAVLKVDPKAVALDPLPLGDSSRVAVGDPVVAIGNPLGYDFSLTSGIVSALGRSIQAPTGAVIPNGIQTDAAINPGNSGGPLINAAGEVIGINQQIASRSGGSEGLGFAVPINTAVRVMEQLRESGKVEHAWLGVGGQTLTPDVAQTFDLPVEHGVVVEQVATGSPADNAGLRGGDDVVELQGQQYVLGGDIITALDGREIDEFDDLLVALAEKAPGDVVDLSIVRDGKEQVVKVTLEARPSRT